VTTKKRTKLTHALRSVFVAPWFLLLPVAAVAADAGKVDFNFQIRPLLSDRCFTCHGPVEQARTANLLLDPRVGLF
jgi:hypothetical protein